jgi:hypothetical protein
MSTSCITQSIRRWWTWRLDGTEVERHISAYVLLEETRSVYGCLDIVTNLGFARKPY